MLKSIRIKLHNRDLRILAHIKDVLKVGRIVPVKNKPYSIYIASTRLEMAYIITHVNGLIRLKRKNFELSCKWLGIAFIEPNYRIEANDPYLAGLIDTDGSIVYNNTNHRIDVSLEFKRYEYSSLLDLDNVIPGCVPYRLNRTKNKRYSSTLFRWQNVGHMQPLYNYFMANRLYSDFKFYRVSKIKQFLELRAYADYPVDSPEYRRFRGFMLDWIQHLNPNWTKAEWAVRMASEIDAYPDKRLP